MGEMAMRCPKCGTENPEGKMFCGDCGTGLPQPPPPPAVQPMQPVYAQPTPSWIRSNWKGLVSVVVVVLVVISVIGLVYTQPWSKIKVIVSNAYAHEIGINVYIDGKLKVAMNLVSGTTIVGVWPVVTGSHVVALDHGFWNIGTGWSGTVYYYSYESPDGIMDYSYDYSVGPLYTKNVFIYVTL